MASSTKDFEKQEISDPQVGSQSKDETHSGSDLSVQNDRNSTEGTVATSSLEWDGDDDPSNPRNWPFGKKAIHTAIPALFGLVITMTTSVYVPAVPYVMVELDVSREVALLPISVFAMGLAVGPLIFAPMSEIFGRKIIYCSTFFMLIAFTGGASVAKNIETLIICRLLAGIFGSAPIAIGAGTIADVWDLAKHGGPAAMLFILAPFLGTSLGTLVGAYTIAEYGNNWRWSLYVVLIICTPLIILSLFMQETFKQQILLAKSKTPKAKFDFGVFSKKIGAALVRPAHMLVTEPLTAFLAIYTGFAFAMMFSFLGSFTYVYTTVYHFNSKEVGLAFIGLIVGLFFSVIVFGALDRTLYQKARIAAGGNAAPEHRLYAMMVGSVLLPIGLFWFAWSARPGVHWIVPVLAGVPFGCANLLIFLSSTTYLVDVYQAHTAASALAANGILRYALGGAFPLFTFQMYENLGIAWAGSLFAFISVLFLPIPFLFFKYGKWLRDRSSYETSRY